MLKASLDKTKKSILSMKETIEMIREAKTKKKLRQIDILLDNLDDQVGEALEK